jgi:hypothetical protein
MDLSITVRFVMARAQLEADAAEYSEIYPEHIFLGILKLSELSADEILPSALHKEQIDEDIACLNKILDDLNINAASARDLLRRAIRAEKPAGNAGESIAFLLTKASENTKGNAVGASDVMNALMEEPPPVLNALFHLDGNNPENDRIEKDNPESENLDISDTRENIAYLSD